jgi:hypothetical protein
MNLIISPGEIIALFLTPFSSLPSSNVVFTIPPVHNTFQT